jgi:hypothetical protein
MGYAKIACCDGCGKKRYVERINGRWLCLDCQDVVTEEQPPATKTSCAVESQSVRAGELGPRYARYSGLARSQVNPAYGSLYRAIAHAVQGFLAVNRYQ